jgi:CIC family chloride channel protein
MPGREAMFFFALLVGIASGFAALAFYGMIEVTIRSFVRLHQHAPGVFSRAVLLLSPALGGLATGYLLHYLAPDAKGGVTEVIDSLLHRGGFIRTRVGFFKSLASAICIGSGGSAGREGPVVQIGASVGSTIAQVFHVNRQRTQILVACGAAAGVAAVFNAPIAGAIFAAEILTGSFQMRDLALLFTASAAGSAVVQWLLWRGPAFPMPAFRPQTGWVLVLFFVLGVFVAVAGHAFIRVLHGLEERFRRSRVPEIWRPALGGLIVGIIGVGLNRTEIFGTGAAFMARVFDGAVFADGRAATIFGLLLLLFLAKMVATGFTLGSGGSGGDLMPSLFLGGALGGAYGVAVHALLPGVALPPAAFALVGASSFFAGVAHAPVTGIVLGIEIGWDIGLTLPLMAACSMSALVASRLRTASIYTLKLEERGIDVEAVRRGGRIPTPEALRGGRLETFVIAPNDPRGGMAVRDLGLPDGVVLVALRRGTTTEAPNGASVLLEGDRVTAFLDPEAEPAFAEWSTITSRPAG